MKTNDIIRAWRDAEFMNSLSAEERAMLPANPAGDVELNDDDLANVNGGGFTTLCPPTEMRGCAGFTALCTVPTLLLCTPTYVTFVFRCVTRIGC